ncbi:hypothetical protein ASE76_12065 [Xylophilus sp. Leaf220]|nr:hypothetical protein ASE76_12065 [Xylophilus sp. Leaf220]
MSYPLRATGGGMGQIAYGTVRNLCRSSYQRYVIDRPARRIRPARITDTQPMPIHIPRAELPR